MRCRGIDFTSAPSRKKRITCLHCTLEGGILRAGSSPDEWDNFEDFEKVLRAPGPWIVGIDFPFGQSRTFIKNIGWPETWSEYVAHARRLGRNGFRTALDAYREGRRDGDKEHRRKTDVAAGSISPQKLYGVPVGLMFFEGAPRLLAAGLMVPHLKAADTDRIAVEAYPGILARQLIDRRSYKHDSKKEQTSDRYDARRDMLEKILNGALRNTFGFQIEAPLSLADDPTGDQLDALLCAIQAAWAWTKRRNAFGAPSAVDPLEGWIADPTLVSRTSDR